MSTNQWRLGWHGPSKQAQIGVPPVNSTAPTDPTNRVLREDGSFALREDGSYELRE